MHFKYSFYEQICVFIFGSSLHFRKICCLNDSKRKTNRTEVQLKSLTCLRTGNWKVLHNVLFGWTWWCACVPETGRVGLPLTSSLPVSSSLLPISCCRPLMPMTAASSGRSGNGEGFSDMAARRKLAASVALGKQVEVRRAHGLLSTWRKRRELRAGERQNTTHVLVCV